MPTLSIGAVLPEKRLLIRVPRAGLRVMMPALSSRAKARRTVIRLQPASRAKSRSAGSRSPGTYSPESRPLTTRIRTCSVKSPALMAHLPLFLVL